MNKERDGGRRRTEGIETTVTRMERGEKRRRVEGERRGMEGREEWREETIGEERRGEG